MSIWQVENSWKFFQTVIICHPLHILNIKVNSKSNSKEAISLRFLKKKRKRSVDDLQVLTFIQGLLLPVWLNYSEHQNIQILDYE